MLYLIFQVGDQRLALDVRRVREVVPRVPLQRPPTAPPWHAGVFVYRGAVVPVVDLHRAMGAGECPEHLSSRIILVERAGGGALVGLLAAQVVDVRQLDAAGGAALADAGGILHVVAPDDLLPRESYDLAPRMIGAGA